MNKVIPGKEVGNQDHLLALDVFFSKDVKGRKSLERNLNSGQSEILKKSFAGNFNKSCDDKLKIGVLCKKSCQMLSKNSVLTS